MTLFGSFPIYMYTKIDGGKIAVVRTRITLARVDTKYMDRWDPAAGL